MAHHHPTPSIGLRPPPASFTSGDAGHGHGGAGGPTSSSRSSSGGSSSSGGQPPFLKVFEAHSARLTDDYLWFMEGRVRLEMQYADQLSLLTQRTRALDSGTDALGKDNQRDALPTVRRAWRQILENSEQEVESRRAFAGAIREEVLAPLTGLKNTQQRIASRIADDVKNSKARYAEQAAALQKLQKAYFQKTQAFVDLTRDSSHPPSGPSSQPHTPLHAPSSSATPGFPHLHAGQSAAAAVATVDQTRERITDLAANSRKGFNSLFANLRSGGSGGGGGEEREPAGGAAGGGGVSRKSVDEARERADAAHRAEKKREQNEAGALKVAKAKREAEDADAKYRLGVFHLESLRINMDKVLQGGSNSAAEFVQELIIHLQSAFSKFAIAHQATEMFAHQVAKRSEEAVGRISLPNDLAGGLSALGGVRGLPAPLLYQNFYVGQCRDLIFGVSLMDYAYARGISATDANRVPLIVAKCIAGVEARGLAAEGLYRISPRQSAVQTLIHQIEIDEDAFEFSHVEEIYTIASILKLYLRQLPEPVFRWPLSERLVFTQDRETHIANDFVYLRQKFKRLPAIHLATLRAVIFHLRSVALADNKMDVTNLSIIFSSILFGEEEVKDIRMLSLGKDAALEDLILYAGQIFAAGPTAADGQPQPAVRSQLLLSRSNTVASTRLPPGQRSGSGAGGGPSLPGGGQGQGSAPSVGGRSRAASASSNATDFNPNAMPPLPSPGAGPAEQQQPSFPPGSRSVHGLGHRRQLSWKSQQEAAAADAGPDAMAPPPLPRRPIQQQQQQGGAGQQDSPLSTSPSSGPPSRHSPGGSAPGPSPSSTSALAPGTPRPQQHHQPAPAPPPLPARAASGLEALTKDADAVLSQLSRQGTPPRTSSLPSSPASLHRATLQDQQQQQQPPTPPPFTHAPAPAAAGGSPLSPSQLQQSTLADAAPPADAHDTPHDDTPHAL